MSFTVLSNGEIELAATDGYQLQVDETAINKLRISAVIQPEGQRTTKRARKFQSAAQIGDVMEDGSIYAGISPDTNTPFFVASADHVKGLSVQKMLNYLSSEEPHGHRDWQIASRQETIHIFENRMLGKLNSLFGSEGRRKRYHFRVKADAGAFTVVNLADLDMYMSRAGDRNFISVRYNLG